MRKSLRKRPTEYHHGDLRGAAVAAALAALDAGRPLPPLRELAMTCGVAHPSLYRHFENADALMLAVAAACFRQFAHTIRRAAEAETEPFVRLRAGSEAAIRWGLAHPGRYALMTSASLAGKQHHREFFEAARETFATLVEAVARCGAADPVPLAHTVMSAMHGLTDLLCKGRTIPDAAASLDDQIAAMLQMAEAFVRAKQQEGRNGDRGVRR